MARLESLAHPYANAVFNVAVATNTTDKWLLDLQQLAAVAKDKDFRELITNPRISHADLIQFLLGVVKDPSQDMENLLELMWHNGRLQVLPELYSLVARKIEESKNQVKVTIQSAFAMSDIEKKQLEELLTKKVGKQVAATVDVMPELIGGIKVLMNDAVIDASIHGGLERLRAQLLSS